MRASFGTISLVFGSFVLYIQTLTTHLTPNKHVWPLIAAGGTVVAFLWPFDWMPEWKDRKQRYGLLHTLAKVLISPFSRVTFARTFVADVLCSMPKLFNDFLVMVCLVGTGEAFRVHWDKQSNALTGSESACDASDTTFLRFSVALSALPFWVRLMQCCRAFWDSGEKRHCFNGLKYCTSMSVVLLSFVSNKEGNGALTYSYRAWQLMSLVSTMCAAGATVFVCARHSSDD